VARDLRTWWVVGAGLARLLGVPRTTLLSAVQAGHIPSQTLGSGEVVVSISAAEKWAEERT
jgi:hypothetical protein